MSAPAIKGVERRGPDSATFARPARQIVDNVVAPGVVATDMSSFTRWITGDTLRVAGGSKL